MGTPASAFLLEMLISWESLEWVEGEIGWQREVLKLTYCPCSLGGPR
jgi:hypothetical protein